MLFDRVGFLLIMDEFNDFIEFEKVIVFLPGHKEGILLVNGQKSNNCFKQIMNNKNIFPIVHTVKI